MPKLPALTAALLAASLLAAPHAMAAPEGAAARRIERQQTNFYRAWFPDLATGRKAAISFHDALLASEWKRGFLVLQLDGADIATLQRFGFRVEPAPDFVAERNRFLDQIDASGGIGVQSIPDFACYETVEETFDAAAQIAADHPQLASWLDSGDSWTKTQGAGGYDMKVLVLGNTATGGDKPKLFVTSAIHAREYTTAPLALAFARWLVDGYGSDPDATWMLDHQEVHLMLHANPDGRKKAETGLLWRKNTDANYCFGNSIGADLNRNFSFSWNSTGGVGSSGNECDETYRGPSPASEPEVQAVESYIRSIWPDLRGPLLTDAAPLDTTGVRIDLHSYSELVLWPWGETAQPAPNGTALQTLGRRFAWFNGYTPTQSIGLYPTDGTSDGPSYGELGVASYTFELGTTFFQRCGSYNRKIKPDNLAALIYAAKVARAPYLLPAGPETTDVALPASVPAGADATLTATVSDTRFNQSNGNEPIQAIAAAAAYIDVPPWAAGAVPIALAAADGSFSSSTEAVTGALPTANLAEGRHLVWVQGLDASGADGPVSAGWLTVGSGGGITLALTSTQLTRRLSRVDLAWSGATSGQVDLYRDGALVSTTANDGAQGDIRPSGTWTYQVCEQGSTTACSAGETITTP